MTEQELDLSQYDAKVDQPNPLVFTDEPIGMGLLRILMLLARHKSWIAIATGVGIVAGLVLSLVLPVRYTATTRIMTPQQTPSSAALLMNAMNGPGAGAFAAAASVGLGLKNPNDIYLGMFSSRVVAEKIVARFDLVNRYHARDMTAALKTLAKRTSIVSEKSGLIAISVSDSDKKFAAEMANAYTDELRSLTNSLAVTEASQRRLFFEEQLKHANENLVAAQVSFQKIQQSKGLVQLDAQAKALIASTATLRAEIATKQVEVQSLRSFSTDQNPEVQLAENQLFSLQRLASEVEQGSHPAASADTGLQDVARAGADYLRAEHEVQYRQVLFDLLLKQYDSARLDEGKSGAIIQVVEPAVQPERKSSPQRPLIVALFTLGGFLCGCAYTTTRDLMQRDPNVSRSISELRSELLSIRGWSISR